MNLFLIDALAPFFTGPMTGRTNWSKIPFARFAPGGMPDPDRCAAIEAQFEPYCRRVAEDGFNAIMLDDLAHLTIMECYPAALRVGIRTTQDWYARLITTANDCGLEVYINTDIMFFTPELAAYIGASHRKALSVLRSACKQLFDRFPVQGLILRLGESDGLDVDDVFHSRLFVKTPLQARRLLHGLLPLFEECKRTLIVRTWTVGAYPIGDLMWNVATFRTVFSRLPTNRLVVSMKPGDTDFYRHVDVNQRFFDPGPPKIIELQARREYEGFGVFPSFTGFDCEQYRRRLKWDANLIGVSVWCQTGGWGKFGGLTFVRDSSIWNELNTAVSLWIFKDGLSAARAVEQFGHRRLPGVDHRKLFELLSLSDRIIRLLWYLPAFSQQRFYFRRVRIPPLLWIFWDTIIITHALRALLRSVVPARMRASAISEGYTTLACFDRLRELTLELGFPIAPIDRMERACRVVAAARDYFLSDRRSIATERVQQAVNEYRSQSEGGFEVELDLRPVHDGGRIMRMILATALRARPRYRLVDLLVVIRLARLAFPLFNVWQKRRMPEFTREVAMGIESLFR